MKRAITLYIGTTGTSDRKADLGDQSFLLFNWATTDVTEIAQVKNGHSCTVTLPGTQNNDDIFGQMQRNDRRTAYGTRDTGAYFDPSARTPFTIYDDSGGVLETGYLKLESVETNGASHDFRVTLYGGLGSFLFSLAYDSQGNKRTLADLTYKLHGTATVVDPGFTISAATVKAAWDRLAIYDQYGWPSDKWEIVNFAPAYNGYPRGAFDANKGLYPVGGFLPAEVDGNTAPNGGTDTVVTFPTKKTEWEVRDLRSYLQRPVLRVAAFMDAICDTANNGGYNVDLSESTLTPDIGSVPGSWITLPLLQDLNLDIEEYYELFTVDEDVNTPATLPVPATPGLPVNYTVKVTPRIYVTGASMLTDIQFSTEHKERVGVEDHYYLNVFVIYCTFWLSGTIVGQSAPIYASSAARGTVIPPGSGIIPDGTRTTHYGYFAAGTGQGNWKGDPLTITFPASVEYDAVSVAAVYVATAENWDDPDNPPTPASSAVWNASDTQKTVSSFILNPSGEALGSLTTTSRSFASVTKAKLLSSDYTPADYLLSLCKMTNHRLHYDHITNTVHVIDGNLYWQGTVVDLSKRINREKPITKTPLQFAARWYEWREKYDHGEWAQYYANVYGRTYGTHRVNTGYEFDANTLEVVDSVLFRGAVSILESSQYYVNVEAAGYAIPAAFLDAGTTYLLTSQTGDAVNAPIPAVDASIRAYMNTDHPYFDIFDKVQFHDADNAGYDERDTLVFLSGMEDVTDRGYILTDDSTTMMELNNDTPCWHLSQPPSGAYALTAIPQFTRYDGDGLLDYGIPAEVPLPDVNVPDLYGVYEVCWKDYIEASFKVDNPVLRCYVNWDGMQVGPDLLRRIYEFDGARWHLNKIINYSLTTWDDTLCEFVKYGK